MPRRELVGLGLAAASLLGAAYVRRAALKARLIVYRVPVGDENENDDDEEHIFDLSESDCREESVKRYLRSLRVAEGRRFSFKSVLLAFLYAKSSHVLMSMAWLVPESIYSKVLGIFVSESVINTSDPLEILDFAMKLPTVASWCVNTELFHYVRKKTSQKSPHECVERLFFGEDAAIAFKKTNRMRIDSQEDVDEWIVRIFGELEPDLKRYDTPQVLFPEILPDLCVGWGGVSPQQTLRKAQRNAFWALIVNRLAANTILKAEGKLDHELFTMSVSNVVDIDSVDKLMLALNLKARLSANSSAFGLMFCVKAPHSRKPTSNHSFDSEKLNDYRQLPYFWPCRTNLLCDPLTDAPHTAVQMSYHCSMQLELEEEFVVDSFRLHLYLGPEGFTGFMPGNEHERPWASFFRIDDPEFSPSEQIEAVKAACAVACVANLSAKKQNYTWGGYVSHGVCTDTVGVIERVVRGTNSMFPYVISGDARATCIAVAKHDLAPALRSKGHSELAAYVELVGNAYAMLPSDVHIDPQDVPDAIRRLRISTLEGLPGFSHNATLRASLDRASEIWSELLE